MVQSMRLPLMKLVRLKNVPILQQLRIEEQLLRTSTHNWCIINDGTNHPTIVMGVSGRPAELLEIEAVMQDQVPVIRRFSGGGTVSVDQETIFVTFILNKDAIPYLQPYPRSIMSWSGLIYSEVFRGVNNFHLRENASLTRLGVTNRESVSEACDYVFGNHKFGGNAQSITKSRWIHHTSFLWDYKARNMAYLKLPERAPEYRLGRNHLDFICRMKEYMPRSLFIERTVEAAKNHFSLQLAQLEDIQTLSDTKFSPSSKQLTEQELKAALVMV